MKEKYTKIFLYVLLAIIGIYFFKIICEKPEYEHFENKKKKLLPIMNPMYNMREWCKQCVLLEDHLTQPRKRCNDCITKHQLTLEGLSEEAMSLDKDNKYSEIIKDIPEKCRELQKRLANGEDHHTISQEYRKIRKFLMPKCKNFF